MSFGRRFCAVNRRILRALAGTSGLRLVAFVAAVPVLGHASAVFFNVMHGLYAKDLTLRSALAVTPASLNGVGILGVAAACLYVEALAGGWAKSSLKRVLTRPDASARADIFYLFLACTGLMPVLGFACSLGAGYYLNEVLTQRLDHDLLRGRGLGAQIAAVTLIHPVVFYFNHRLFHTKLFWRLHEIHHAATEFNVITNFRTHPLDITIRTIFYTLPTAVLGIRPEVTLAYSAITGALVCFQHSSVRWPAWLERHLIGSATHRIHHGKDPRFVDKNFGILVVWDRLFGTYEPPASEAFPLGVDDALHLHNSGRPVRDLWRATKQAGRDFARGLVGRGP
jgi:sterol desaturase/sphingolipid hydroxylase (fatty acid hydroxylase superfamily)